MRGRCVAVVLAYVGTIGVLWATGLVSAAWAESRCTWKPPAAPGSKSLSCFYYEAPTVDVEISRESIEGVLAKAKGERFRGARGLLEALKRDFEKQSSLESVIFSYEVGGRDSIPKERCYLYGTSAPRTRDPAERIEYVDEGPRCYDKLQLIGGALALALQEKVVAKRKDDWPDDQFFNIKASNKFFIQKWPDAVVAHENMKSINYVAEFLAANDLTVAELPGAEEFVTRFRMPVEQWEVQNAQSLWTISAQTTGFGKNWPILWAINSVDIKDPNKIELGQKIAVPAMELDGQKAGVAYLTSLAIRAKGDVDLCATISSSNDCRTLYLPAGALAEQGE